MMWHRNTERASRIDAPEVLSMVKQYVPTCPTCRERWIPDDGAPLPVVAVITDRAVVLSSTRDDADGLTHAIQLSDVTFVYELAPDDRGEWVACSMPEKRLHRYGLVGTTVCGRTLNVGRDCAAKWVGDIFKRVDGVRQYDRDLAALATAPALVEEVKSHAEEVSRLCEARRHIRDHLWRVHKMITDRTKDEKGRQRTGGAVVEVITLVAVMNKEGKTVSKEVPRNMTGFELWSAPPNCKAILEKLEDVADLVRAVRRDRTRTDVARVRKALSALKRVRDQAAAATEWVRNASMFFSPSNLELVRYAANAESDYDIEEGCIVHRVGRLRFRIGSFGVHQERLAA